MRRVGHPATVSGSVDPIPRSSLGDDCHADTSAAHLARYGLLIGAVIGLVRHAMEEAVATSPR
jgi:hypothetical protein